MSSLISMGQKWVLLMKASSNVVWNPDLTWNRTWLSTETAKHKPQPPNALNLLTQQFNGSKTLTFTWLGLWRRHCQKGPFWHCFDQILDPKLRPNQSNPWHQWPLYQFSPISIHSAELAFLPSSACALLPWPRLTSPFQRTLWPIGKHSGNYTI